MTEPGAMRDLICEIARAFAAVSQGRCVHPPRSVIGGTRGTTLLMGAAIEGMGRTAKVVSVFPANLERGQPTTQGMLMALCPTTGKVLALMDAARITAWRTGAASGLATDLMAAPEAKRLALIGSGAQALTQAIAVCAVRKIDRVQVFSRSQDRLRRFCEQAELALRVPVKAMPSCEAALKGAEIVCTATSSAQAVLDGAHLAPGTHINAVGSFRLGMRELDRRTIERASIVVDERAAALAEAGELVDAIEAGITSADRWTELGELVEAVDGAEAPSGANPSADLSLFKSVGHPAQDVAAAAFFLAHLEASDLRP